MREAVLLDADRSEEHYFIETSGYEGPLCSRPPLVWNRRSCHLEIVEELDQDIKRLTTVPRTSGSSRKNPLSPTEIPNVQRYLSHSLCSSSIAVEILSVLDPSASYTQLHKEERSDDRRPKGC